MSELLVPSQLHDYQRECVIHQLTHNESMLWLQMGLGKTIITLTTIVDRIRMNQVNKVLIFGPLRVIQAVWARESRKWEHTKHLRFSVMHGTKEQRTRALFADADVFLTNYENMNWLVETLKHYYIDQNKTLPFNMVVYDEVSKLKNSQAIRMKGGSRTLTDKFGDEYKIKVHGWKDMIEHFDYLTGLTGTPASNGYLDLFGQYYAIDMGERLGKYITHYKNAYFTSDYNGWSYTPTPEGKSLIESNISDVTKKIDAKDYLDMPEVKTTNILVELPPKAVKVYKELEKNMFTMLDSGEPIEVTNKASVYNKCLQFCNGSPYTDLSGTHQVLHDAKLDALESVLEEAAGQPVLCSYSFKSDAERIMQRFKKYKPVNLTAAKSSTTESIINRWSRGEIKLLIGHPASMGHGVDGLQESGSILVWFGLNWSLELYEQMCGRLDRQGQVNTVSVIRILCDNTVDLAVLDAIVRKNDTQEGLKNSLQRYREGNNALAEPINQPISFF